MRTAKATAQAIVLDCPHCEETIASVSGSFFWSSDEYANKILVKCHNCGKSAKIPTRAIIEC